MARVTVEDCIARISSQYDLVLMAKERASQLNTGEKALVPVDNDKSIVVLDEKTLSKLDTGSYTLKVFAASDEAMRPYEYSTSFLVSDTLTSLPHAEITTTLSESNQSDYSSLLIIVILILSAAVIFVVKARVKRGQKSIT